MIALAAVALSGTRPVLAGWVRTITGAAGGLDQYAYSVAVDANGDAVAAGTLAAPYVCSAGDWDFVVVKVRASDGEVVWQQVLTGTQTATIYICPIQPIPPPPTPDLYCSGASVVSLK